MELQNRNTTRNPERIPVALTIAGSDSGGGAGIQADLRTFSANGVFGTSAITAVTSQNPTAVARVDALPPDAVAEQIRSVLDVIDIRAIKTGMLFSAGIIQRVAECLKPVKLPLVVDPVMISTSGSRLLDEAGLQAMKNELLPLASMITPNIPEAEWLTGSKLRNQPDYIKAATLLAQEYKCNVLLKTGHSAENGNRICDIAIIDQTPYLLASPRIGDLSEYASHGTGCTLSSGITAMLAANCSWKDALRAAKAHVYGALNETAHIGKELDGMYPPLEDYSKFVTLAKLTPANTSGKGPRA